MIITFPSNTREIINAIRDAIGRDVHFHYAATLSGCSVCNLDPVNNTSTDPFCPVCSGRYWIPVYSSLTRKAHVFWKGGEEVKWLPTGTILDGDVTIQIEYSGGIDGILDKTDYVVVDGKRMEIRKRIYRGIPDINRIILILQEYEKED